MAAGHWLDVAAGGLPDAGAGFWTVPGGWRRLEVAMWQVHRIPLAALGAEPLHRTTVTLTEMGRSFERASANGLAWTPLASLDAAMVGFVRKASECVANDPALWVVAAPQC